MRDGHESQNGDVEMRRLRQEVAELRAHMRGLRRLFVLSAAALLFGIAVVELGSETFTLSTTYPSPAGCYANMTTTQRTVLARDAGGYVVVGSAASPAAGAKMVVMNGNVGIGTTAPASLLSVNGAAEIAQNSALKLGEAYFSSGGNYMHLASNAWYNGSAWQVPDLNKSSALLQFGDVTSGNSTITFYQRPAKSAATAWTAMPIGQTAPAGMSCGFSECADVCGVKALRASCMGKDPYVGCPAGYSRVGIRVLTDLCGVSKKWGGVVYTCVKQ